MPELRHYPRLNIPLAASFRTHGSDQWREGQIQNLSAGGAALATSQRLAKYTVLDRFRFELPGIRGEAGTEIDVRAVVAWIQIRISKKQQVSYVAGVQFLDLEDELLETVRDFVFYRIRAGER